MGRWDIGAGSGVRGSPQTSPSQQANEILICDSGGAIFVLVKKNIPALKGRGFAKLGGALNHARFQNCPRNLATAMRVSIDTAVQRCEVRKVMRMITTVRSMQWRQIPCSYCYRRRRCACECHLHQCSRCCSGLWSYLHSCSY